MGSIAAAALSLVGFGQNEGPEVFRREVVGVARPLANHTVGSPRGRCRRWIRAIESSWQKRSNSPLSLLAENGTHLIHGRASRKVLGEGRCVGRVGVACPTQLTHMELRAEPRRHRRVHGHTGVKACKALERGGLDTNLCAVASFVVTPILGRDPGDHLDGVFGN